MSETSDDPHEALLDLADMIGPVSHELLNVLNNVVLKAAVLARAVPEDLRKQVAEFRTLGHRASELLAGLQHVRQSIHLTRQPLDLNAVVQNAVSPCQLTPDLPAIWGHPVDTPRLVCSLIRLARAWAPEPVQIATERTSSAICLRVSADGPALADQELGDCFDPFGPFRPGEQLRERAVCLTIARRLGAVLRAETGQGLTLIAEFEPAPETRR